MKRTAFSYSVLRYVHDVASGECLNVGVILYAPSERFVRAKIQHEYARLSRTFQDFYGEYYRKVARHLENKLNGLSEKWLTELAFQEMPLDARTVANVVLPPDDSSLQFSEPQNGVAVDLPDALESLFERLVLRNQPQEGRESRTNDEVWRKFKDLFVERSILPKLQPVVIAGGSFEYEFEHAWKNAKWHPLEALSMDAEKGDTLRDRAVRWVGRATDLKSDEKLGKLYLLVGPPELESLSVPYGKALTLLDKMPIEHQIVKEDEAEDFASSFSELVKRAESEHQSA